MASTFRNEPLRDFSEARHRLAIAEALDAVESRRLARALEAAPIIGGEIVRGNESFRRMDPSDRAIVLGTVHFADILHAEQAVRSCLQGFPQWRATPFSERTAILRRIAAFMRERRAFLTALIIREAGKPWKEADGDVAEAIDFCEYYALEMDRLGPARRTEVVLGEDNVYLYQPRGVAAVISPWNFPLAITCGMAVAALVAGNTVILKPAEQASLIAAEFAAIVYEAGVPKNAFAFLPGRGEIVGRHLVAHSQVDLIAFTGSRAVGLEIIKSAAQISEGQRCIKKVIAELGGKNAIIVDEDADMDDAIRGVLASAFGFGGQKCSACSRLIVVGSAYEPFLERLGHAVHDLIIGEASDPAVFLGPVIDHESYDRITATIGSAAGTVALLAQTPIAAEIESRGYFVPPTVFRDVPSDHPMWRDEIFGPVLACAKASSFEEALNCALTSDYALTGGVYSRHPAHIAQARNDFRIGNLYINRSITGALVGRQPFGGFAFSGIGSKAGGPDYLIQFMEPRVITENTMRRGFTPDLS